MERLAGHGYSTGVTLKDGLDGRHRSLLNAHKVDYFGKAVQTGHGRSLRRVISRDIGANLLCTTIFAVLEANRDSPLKSGVLAGVCPFPFGATYSFHVALYDTTVYYVYQ